MLERGPITMRLISPRSTAPYQTLDSSSRTTSPITVAPGTTHALEWMVGPFLKRAAIPACPVVSVSGVICMLAINLQRPIRLRKATARQALNVQRFVTQTIVSAGDLISLALADKIGCYYGGFEICFWSGFRQCCSHRPVA